MTPSQNPGWSRRSILALAAVATCYAWFGPGAAPARAQAKAPAPEGAAFTAAQQYIDVGTRLFKEGSYPEALQAFLKARALVADPRLLYLVGRSHEELGHARDALTAYQEILDSAPASPEGPKAIEAIARLRNTKLGRLSVRCLPASATLELDGASPGHGAATFADLLPGKHRLRAQADGYEERSWELEVQAGQELKASVELKAKTVPVDVLSTPTGAEAELDGRPVGKTPLRQLELAPGKRVLRLTLAGHRTETRSLELTSGAPVSVEATLLPEAGTLTRGDGIPASGGAAAAEDGPSVTFWVAAGTGGVLLGTGLLLKMMANGKSKDVADLESTGATIAFVGSGIAALTAVLLYLQESGGSSPPQAASAVQLGIGPACVTLTARGDWL